MAEPNRYLTLKSLNLRLFFDLSVALLMIALFSIWISRYSLPGSQFVIATEQLFGSDSNMHLSFGFLLTLCVGWLLRLWQQSLRRQLWLFSAVMLCFGLDELAQYFFSTRSVNLQDFLMSLSGWGLAVITWFAARLLFIGDFKR